MKFEDVTPILLTYNETPNIGRTLGQLRWAREVLVVDSLSSDSTPQIVAGFENTRFVVRPFDSFANQWNFAVNECDVRTDWILALCADYLPPDDFASELATLDPEADVGSYRAPFAYCVLGRPLRGSAYPPVTVLVRRRGANFRQDGHAYRIDAPLRPRVEVALSARRS